MCEGLDGLMGWSQVHLQETGLRSQGRCEPRVMFLELANENVAYCECMRVVGLSFESAVKRSDSISHAE